MHIDNKKQQRKDHSASILVLHNYSMDDDTENVAFMGNPTIIGIQLKNGKIVHLNSWIFVKTEINDFYSMTNKTWYEVLQLHFLTVEYRIFSTCHRSNHCFCNWWLRLRYLRNIFLMVRRGGIDVLFISMKVLLVLDSIVWDHIMHSCLSTRGICGKTNLLCLMRWQTTFLLVSTRHTKNPTNHCDCESFPFKICILQTVSINHLTVGRLFHW